jgi:nitrogen fixation protein NifQ
MNTHFFAPAGSGGYDGFAGEASLRDERRELASSPLTAGSAFRKTYGWMARSPHSPPADRFDIHALASVFALALAETDWGRTASLTEALGLSFDDVVLTVVGYFPHALMEIGPVLGRGGIVRSDKEASLLELLSRGAGEKDGIGERLAQILARRAQRPNALWQELGLRSRGELSKLMKRHFPALAERNVSDIRWKAHLYRSIAQRPGDMLCTTPSCLECDDFFRCFGEEAPADQPVPNAST